ncbi:unnamed protein product [Pleuronectes platessa]|uniref:Uncharacterized protein n=1 Tax=Pleuronectes platessa TaxID=8262 RepID=A0A9N7VWT0_PLEPL|nr:unnamed protein product [Pleuronectes platessa]
MEAAFVGTLSCCTVMKDGEQQRIGAPAVTLSFALSGEPSRVKQPEMRRRGPHVSPHINFLPETAHAEDEGCCGSTALKAMIRPDHGFSGAVKRGSGRQAGLAPSNREMPLKALRDKCVPWQRM